MTAHYRADTDALGLGRPDHEPLASETIGPIIDYIQALIDRGHAYAVDGDVYFRVRSDSGYGSLSHRRLEDMDQGEGVEGAERKQDPLDFALWKAHKEGEDTFWEAPWGAGRPGWHIECSAMAEQLLGVGFDIHGGGSDLLFPHHENEAAQTRAARGQELARLWMHNGMIQFTGEKMAKSVGQHRPAARGARRPRAPRRSSCTWSPATTASRWPSPRPRWSRRRRTSAASARRGAGCRRGAEPRRSMAAPARALLRRAAPTTSTPPRRWPSLNEWIREATAAAARASGDADLREMLGVLGLESLLAARAQQAAGDAEVRALAEQRERARGGARLRRPPTACAMRSRERGLGGPRRRRRARAAAAVIVYGRNPVREALRGRRRRAASAEVWATAGAAREPWLRGRRRCARVGAEEIERRCGSERPPGRVRRGGRLSLRRAPESCSARREPLLVALDQVQDPQNLGSICRTAECAGAGGVVIPERRAAEVTPGGVQGLGGGRRAPAGRARAQHGRLPRRGPRGGLLVLRGQRRGRPGRARRRSPYDAPDYSGAGVVLVLGSEGTGLRPRVAGACDELIALPLLGADRVARGGRGGRGAAVRDLAESRPKALTRLHNCVRLAPT